MQVNNYNTYGTKYAQHMAKYNARKNEQMKKMEEILTGASENKDKADFQNTDKISSGIAFSVNASSKETPKLSETAQEYLEKLKSKYKDMDFIIADYSSNEEASEILSKGKSEINVLIDPETLEKMATDENVRAEYEGYIDSAKKQISDMKENLKKELGEEIAGSVKSYGFSVDGGKVSYTAVIEDILTDSKERAEETKEFVEASSVTELAEKIRAKIKEKQEAAEKAGQDNKSDDTGMFVRRNGHFKQEYTTPSDTEALLEVLKNQSSASGSIFDYMNNDSKDDKTSITDNIMDLFA